MGEKYEKYINDNQEDANEFISNYLNCLIEETKDNIDINWIYKKGDEEFFNKFYQKFVKKRNFLYCRFILLFIQNRKLLLKMQAYI